MMRGSLAALIACACSSARPAPEAQKRPGITLEELSAAKIVMITDGCMGPCPLYVLAISPAGKLVYEGRGIVKVAGRQEADLTPAQLEQLDRAFSEAGYFELADSYTRADVRDAPSVTLLYESGPRRKLLRHSLGDPRAPEALKNLEMAIPRLAGIEQWIGTREEREAVMHSVQR